jgi:hypothetical protein
MCGVTRTCLEDIESQNPASNLQEVNEQKSKLGRLLSDSVVMNAFSMIPSFAIF